MRYPGISFYILLIFLLPAFKVNGQYYLHKQWDKRYGGSKDDSFFQLLSTIEGGFVLCGISPSPADGDKSQGNQDSTLTSGDAWLIKVDSIGNKQWDRRFGGTKGENAVAILQTKDNNYAFIGLSNSPISGDKSESCRGQDDYWLVKVDANGNKIWDKRYGGTREDGVMALTLTPDGGFLLGGDSYSNATGDKSQPNWDPTGYSTDYWIVKTDSQGNKLWDKRFGGVDDDILIAICPYFNGGWLLAGYSSSDSSGDKTIPSKGDADFWLVAIDSAGNKLWDRVYGGSSTEFLWTIDPMGDGFILSGSSYSSISGDKSTPEKGDLDYWIIKINGEADVEWDRDFGGNKEEFLQSTAVTNDNGLLLAGSSRSNKWGDKSEDNWGAAQAWLVKTDSLGNKEWDKTIVLDSMVTNVYATTTTDGCYVVGVATKAEAAGYKTEPGRGGQDYWIMKFCADTFTTIAEPLANAAFELQVYPNPSSQDVSIYLHKPGLKNATFTITNSLGQTVYQKQENNLSDSYTKMLDISYLPAGTYFVSVMVGNQKAVKQIVKH